MRLSVVVPVLAALGGCVSDLDDRQPNYYIASVYRGGHGQLMADQCELDDYGHATEVCTSVAIDDPDAPSSPMPDGPDLPSSPRASRPAPDAAAVTRAIRRSGAARLVSLCRTTYAASDPLDATLAIAPTGAVTSVELRGADGPFADCTATALRTTTIAPFDGAPVRVEQTLAP